MENETATLTAAKRRQSWVPAKVVLKREDDPLRHELIDDPDESWPAGTRDLANKLEHLGVDSSWTRRRVQQLLKEEEVKARTVVLGAALRLLARGERGLSGIIYEEADGGR